MVLPMLSSVTVHEVTWVVLSLCCMLQVEDALVAATACLPLSVMHKIRELVVLMASCSDLKAPVSLLVTCLHQ